MSPGFIRQLPDVALGVSKVNGQKSKVNGQQPTINSQQPTVNSQQPTVNGYATKKSGGIYPNSDFGRG